MYPNEPTHTEELIQAIENQSPKITEILKEYIEAHDTTKMIEGERYYYKENDITKRQIYKYTNDGQKVIDIDATNNKLASGWHKLLVDQKTSYLVGEPVTIGSKSDKDIEPITETLGDEFDDTLPELVTAASNKGREWLHVYIDEDGEFDYLIIPAQEGIPIYDNTKRKNLDAFIRYYTLDDGETIKIELWDREYVTFYEMLNGTVYLDASVKDNPQSHWFKGNAGYGWGKVPFIEFANNSKRVSDLTFYKDFIDAYDLLMSDSANTLEDVQQFLYEIKGYEGSDPQEVATNLKRFKIALLDGEGEFNIKQGEVPMDAINSYLDRLMDDIYAQGQGVDLSADKFGNSPSGIALKFLFSLLDMKASVLERKFSKGLRQLIWFVCEYLRESGQGNFDYKDVTFTFNHSILVNELENAQIAQMSKGIISDDTILANHNWVTDIEEEKRKLEEQQESMIDLNTPIEGGEDE